MTTLLKNGTVVNVFTGVLEKVNVLIEDKKIIGVGDYYQEADVICDVSGKYICPGFIDGHVHIESTMMTPYNFAKAVLACGTTSVVADPHEIANVCGKDGIKYILSASRNLPLCVYINLPSCVPATCFDQSGYQLTASDLKPLYNEQRVLGLAEMMNYPGVIFNDKQVHEKISDALKLNKIIDGHAPLLSGKELDKYIAAGVQTDHECSSYKEACEKITKGQWVMIRQGTAAKNLADLIELFEPPFANRCLLVTDDIHPSDLIKHGHIDNIIRTAVSLGKDVITAIRMATINAATCFGLKYVGAVAPGYRADLLVLDDLEKVKICNVYSSGKLVCSNGTLCEFEKPEIPQELLKTVTSTCHVCELTVDKMKVGSGKHICRVIETVKGQLLTNEKHCNIDFDQNGGICTEQDILKLAVVERHHNTGQMGIGFINGLGLKKGAVACSVAHDSHNIVVAGTNDSDIVFAVNAIIKMGGGCVAVNEGKEMCALPLPVGGLMSDQNAQIMSQSFEELHNAVDSLCQKAESNPLMTLQFMSLPVIFENDKHGAC